jgi:hypothetical protein
MQICNTDNLSLHGVAEALLQAAAELYDTDMKLYRLII